MVLPHLNVNYLKKKKKKKKNTCGAALASLYIHYISTPDFLKYKAKTFAGMFKLR